MKLSQLRNLVAIAEAGSVRQAAREINLSQSAITKSIQLLEEELGTKLLDRASHGVSPTASGQALVDRAKIIETELRNARADIENIEHAVSGEIRLLVSPSVAVSFAPRAIAEFHRKRPRVSFHVEESLFPDNLSAVRKGEIDIAICLLAERLADDDLRAEVLIEDEVSPAVRADHPLLRRRHLSLADLLEENWIQFGRGVSSRAIHEQTFRVNGLEPPQTTITCASLSCALALVENSDYLVLAPKQLFSHPRRGLPIMPLRLTTPTHPWTTVAITRARPPLSPACVEFLAQLRQVAQLTMYENAH